MAKISLRDYNHKIESMIDRGQNDEAVFHCLSILGVYPKSVDTYRNLGKALLESKRYSEASEIFSKLLTVVPDDFISHVGQSIIAEEDRDLDTAIWHMEQSFELQPSNLALQEELRRLIGRRDGAPPSKIRLTRGALVRMYVRGDLYQQAISEIQSALKDDPRRVDLRVLLAKMYHQAGQNVEAAEVCSGILSTSPYCFEANKIMYELLQDSDERKIYKDRLNQLDPYLEFSSFIGQPANEIPSEKVLVEEAVFSSASVEPEVIPDWAKNIGIEWKEEGSVDKLASGDLSAFVSDEPGRPETPEPFSPFISDQQTTEQKTVGTDDQSLFSDEVIPDWIKNAGWSRSTEPEKAPEVPVEYESPISPDEAQPAGDLPDWLKSLQPETEKDFILKDSASIADLTGGPVPEADVPDEAFPSSDELKDSIANWSRDIEPLEESSEAKPTPDQSSEWVNQFMDEQGKPLSENESADLPDWLKNYDKEEPSEETTQTEVPDWLSSLEAPEIGEPPDLKDILEIGEPPELKDIPEVLESAAAVDAISKAELIEPDLDQPIPLMETTSPQDSFPVGEVSSTDQTLQNLIDSSSEQVDSPQPVPAFDEELPETPSLVSERDSKPELPDLLPEQSPELPVEIPQEAARQSVSVPSWIDEILSSALPAAVVTEVSEAEKLKDMTEEVAPLVTELPPELPHEGILSDETSNELLDWLNELSPEEKLPETPAIATVDFAKEIPARVNTSELTLEKLSEENLELVTGNETPVEIEEGELIAEIEPLDYTDRLSELITEEKDETVSTLEIESNEITPPPIPEFNEPIPAEIDQILQVPGDELIPSEDIIDQENPILEFQQNFPETIAEETTPEGIIDQLLPEKEFSTSLSGVPSEEPNLDALIETDHFEDLVVVAENRLGDNLPIKDLIEKLNSAVESKGGSQRFWQSYGDLLGKDSDFDSALDAYQKAENLILSK